MHPDSGIAVDCIGDIRYRSNPPDADDLGKICFFKLKIIDDTSFLQILLLISLILR